MDSQQMPEPFTPADAQLVADCRRAQTFAMPPNLAAGLVKAQAAVETVINDGRVDFGRTKYNYATQAAIADCARKALAVGRLALHVGAWRIEPPDKPSMLTATVTLMHESGECMPPYDVCMPIVGSQGASLDKALAAALTNARKYAAAAALGMGWEDADADVEQRDVPPDQRRTPQTRQPAQARSEPQTRQPLPKIDLEVQAAHARATEIGKAAGAKIRQLLDIDGNEAYGLATGIDTWPGSRSTPLDFLALHTAHMHMGDGTDPPPTSHVELLERIENPDDTLIYANGQLTSCGREMANKLSIAV